MIKILFALAEVVVDVVARSLIFFSHFQFDDQKAHACKKKSTKREHHAIRLSIIIMLKVVDTHLATLILLMILASGCNSSVVKLFGKPHFYEISITQVGLRQFYTLIHVFARTLLNSSCIVFFHCHLNSPTESKHTTSSNFITTTLEEKASHSFFYIVFCCCC